MSPRTSAAAAQAGRSSPGDTKERILDAAEGLFSEQGVAGTSLRAITSAAGANVAAVHYHYGGREELLRAVLQRRLGAVNEERLQRLQALEDAAEAPSVEAVLEAFLAPAVLRVFDDPGLSRVSDLLLTDPAVRAGGLVVEIFGDVFDRFSRCLEQLLPELPPQVLRERLRFVIGAMVHALHGPSGFPGLEDATASRTQAQETLAHLQTFLSAGLRAPHGESR